MGCGASTATATAPAGHPPGTPHSGASHTLATRSAQPSASNSTQPVTKHLRKDSAGTFSSPVPEAAGAPPAAQDGAHHSPSPLRLDSGCNSPSSGLISRRGLHVRAPRLQAAAAAAASKAVACPVRQDAAPLLATVPFFDNLDKHGARLLQTMFKRHEVEAGESLVDWGGMGYGDIFFVVVSGRLELVALWAGATSLSSLASQDASRSYRRPSAYSLQLGPGEFFGESALFLGRVCAIETVRALEKSTVLTITREKFKQFVEEVPSMRTTAEIREMGGMAPIVLQLQSIPFFRGVEEDKLLVMSGALKVVRVPAGERIITEGDIGDGFYILARGTAIAFVMSQSDDHAEASPSGSPRPPSWSALRNRVGARSQAPLSSQLVPVFLNVLKKGAFFGETALLAKTRRTASIDARTDVVLLYLSNETFKSFFEFAPELMNEDLQRVLNQRTANVLKTIPMFSLLAEKRTGPHCRFDEHTLSLLGALFSYVQFDADEMICRAGDVADSMYILTFGTARVQIPVETNDTTTPVEVATLTRGQVFGEVALLEDTCRTADVIAETACTLLKLDKDKFNKFLTVFPQARATLRTVFSERTTELIGRLPFFKVVITENKPWSKTSLLGTLFRFLSCEQGTVLAHEGSPSPGLYLIVQGTVEAKRTYELDGGDTRCELKGGAHFGEFSLLDHDEERWTFTAQTRLLYLLLPRDSFEKLSSVAPEIKTALKRRSHSSGSTGVSKPIESEQDLLADMCVDESGT